MAEAGGADVDHRAILDRLPAPAAVVRDGVVRYANPAFASWLGCARAADVIGVALMRCVHADDVPAVARILARPEGAEADVQFLRRDGRVVRGTLSTAPASAQDPEAVILSVRPVAADDAAYARLRVLEAAVDHLHDIVFITEAEPRDGGRRVVFVNAAFTRVSGYTAEEVIGKTPSMTIGPETDRAALARIEEALRARRSVHEELRKYRKDGTSYYVEMDVVPVFDSGGRHTHWVSVQRDITERRVIDERLVESERLAAIGTLAAGVAHEINNPVAYVGANVDFVASEIAPHAAAAAGKGPEPRSAPRWAEIVDALRDARDGVSRVRAIVRDLRTFSRGGDESREQVDPRAAMDAAVAIASHRVRGRARLVKEYDDVPPVLASETRLVQVFVNLLVNAADAMPSRPVRENEVKLRVRLGPGGSVVAEVQDNGVGIPPEARGKLFVPFFTTKPVGSGTGLGLAICHGIVRSLGGDITFETETGRGTTFRVTLPSHTDVIAMATGAGAATTPTPRARVLVVDDEPAVGAAIRRLLGDAHDVASVTSAREARAAMRAGPGFDVVLCDVLMPGESGTELLQSLARDGDPHARRFVFVTGAPSTPALQAVLARGPTPVLHKPFDAAQLHAVVRANATPRS